MTAARPDDAQGSLFDELPQPAGPVWAAARRTIRALVLAGRLDEDTDALTIAHIASLSTTIDQLTGYRHAIDPRALTMLSRELRAVADQLGLSRGGDQTKSGPFDFLDLDPAAADHP